MQENVCVSHNDNNKNSKDYTSPHKHNYSVSKDNYSANRDNNSSRTSRPNTHTYT